MPANRWSKKWSQPNEEVNMIVLAYHKFTFCPLVIQVQPVQTEDTNTKFLQQEQIKYNFFFVIFLVFFLLKACNN